MSDALGTMDHDNKVFSSNITRVHVEQKNDLYELLNIVPATPISVHKVEHKTCEFCPKFDKHYVPKKKSRLKVKTVRDIKNMYEQDTYNYLYDDLEKQQNVLLKKIRGGSSREENTKLLAKNMLKDDNPLTRSAWQMLVNINPDKHAHPTQFVLWNGKTIQVNGSKGGKNMFICNYDLANNRLPPANKNIHKLKVNHRNKLLQNSLNVKFKPGPLGRKKFLDDSYQKYHVGDTELINLPKPGLDIQPAYGVSFESTITNFLNGLRDEKGGISQKWAELAVTALGTINDSKPIQLNKESCITFDLNYNYEQRRILMRRDIDKMCDNRHIPDYINLQKDSAEDESVTRPEIKEILEKILDSVEISLRQDEMYCIEEPRKIASEIPPSNGINTKDKMKRKYGELDRLAVTVIRLPESPQKDVSKLCGKSYCSLGCICESLNCAYNLKQHCGLVKCMFECKCNFSKYKDIKFLGYDCSNIIPGLLKLDREINLNLAKEEQKFHQTVIMTGEKSILLKTQKRNWKASKKYGDFYNNICLTNDEKPQPSKILTVAVSKLDCENVEHWCMVHNLYKCFCKGKYTDTSMRSAVTTETSITKTISCDLEATDKNNDSNYQNILRPRKRLEKNGLDQRNRTNSISESVSENSSIDLCSDHEDCRGKCARTSPYKGRKYSHDYYKNTNNKILEMEKNDTTLRKKMMLILSKNECEYLNLLKEYTGKRNDLLNSIASTTVNKPPAHTKPKSKIDCDNVNVTPKRLLSQTELVPWFATNYKLYQQRERQGKITLEAPQFGKMALYAWEFILNRYKEQKNLFLVSTQKPFRIFMAVHTKHPYLERCMNINDIRFADLHKYPITVKNLLTNATDSKRNFCILAGSSFYWEIIGSVSKINETEQDKLEDKELIHQDKLISPNNAPVDEDNEWVVEQIDESNKLITKLESDNRELKETESCISEPDGNSDSSNWFVMTIENDFSEIHFKKKGFFIKYNSIIQAINVSRMSGKTVRLSTQTCVDKNNGPQFGLYAIPNLNEYCVFVGPYETDEQLGITTVKTFLDIKKTKRTRGVWITTNKVDNLKVIDNPLSFMLPEKMQNKEMVPIESDLYLNANTEEKIQLSLKIDENKTNKIEESLLQAKTTQTNQMKVVKPITIRKTNSFYRLGCNSLLKTISLQKEENLNKTATLLLNKSSTLSNELTNVNSLLSNDQHAILNKSTDISDNIISSNSAVDGQNKTTTNLKKPVAEIAPQIKISFVSSLLSAKDNQMENKKMGMSILKPEEINKKMLENKTIPNTGSICDITTYVANVTSNLEDTIDKDVEKFLANSAVCSDPQDNVYVISDDEESGNTLSNDTSKEVWIQCVNIDNFGWIRGRRNDENLLSFELPGFNYSEFYVEEAAFSKINQVLSRKIYIPKHIKLEWKVIESEDKLKRKNNMLQTDHISPEFILTKHGLRNTLELKRKNKGKLKTYSKIHQKAKVSPTLNKAATSSSESVEMTSSIITELEETSRTLEDESNILWNETVTKKAQLINTLSDMSDARRSEMTETLKSIISMSEK